MVIQGDKIRRTALLSVVIAGAALASAPALAQQAASSPMRVVNVTDDSAKGWLPTEEQERIVRERTLAFLAAQDSGRFDEAYDDLTPANRLDSRAAFSKRLAEVNTLAGKVRSRQILTVTWTKDPADAPAPGVYAAIDLVSQFERIDRHCGYIILYQAPGGGAFQVARQEDAFFDNATAKGIAKDKSPMAVDTAWAEISAHCPGYAQARIDGRTPSLPLAENGSSDAGHPSVAATLATLKARKDVVVSDNHGWTIVADDKARTIWSFAPASDPSYPAVVRREVIQASRGLDMHMDVTCEASKAACDRLVLQFQQLNAEMIAQMKGKQ